MSECNFIFAFFLLIQPLYKNNHILAVLTKEIAQCKRNLKIKRFFSTFFSIYSFQKCSVYRFSEVRPQTRPSQLAFSIFYATMKSSGVNCSYIVSKVASRDSLSFRLNMNKKTAAAGSYVGTWRKTRGRARRLKEARSLELPMSCFSNSAWHLNYLGTFQLTANKFSLVFRSKRVSFSIITED